MSLLAERQQKIVERSKELVAFANERFNITLPEITFDFNKLKGTRVCGRACRRANKSIIQINSALLIQSDADWKDALLDTLPHELAHVVCQFNPHLGRGHNAGWRLVAAALGATPKATGIASKIIYAKGETYIYTLANGQTVNLSYKKHNAIQAGANFTMKKSGLALNRLCSFTVLDQGTVSIAARTTDNSATAQRTGPATTSKAVAARAIMRECVAAGIGYEETIQKIMEVTGHPKHLAKACYKVGYEVHGIGK